MKTIGIDQSLSNMFSFEHKCFNNINNIYQHAGKCDDQQNIKDVLDADMLYIPEKITDVSPSLRKTPTTVKKTSASKSLCLFTNIFDIKNITSICCFWIFKIKT